MSLLVANCVDINNRLYTFLTKIYFHHINTCVVAQGRSKSGQRGHNDPGAEPLGTPKSPNNVASTFFSTVRLLPERT